MKTSQAIKALTIEVLRIPGNPMAGTKRIWRGSGSTADLTVTLSDHKRLERSKYAPWGRGELGGKAVA